MGRPISCVINLCNQHYMHQNIYNSRVTFVVPVPNGGIVEAMEGLG